MEASKVRVEYNDVSNAFGHVEHALRSQLPLRNLHWNSASRPLRSIDSLHVDLVPEPSNLAPPVHLKDGSSDQTRTSTSTEGISKKERRHQIPGLRQTPYLRICFFQCEDVDTYKANSRGNLREWVAKSSNASQGAAITSRQENHDASEWLLVHVEVEPFDPQGPSDRKEKDNPKKASTSKWKSRGTKSVLDKVRADFHTQSKGTQDRITQVTVERPAEAGTETTSRPRRNVSGIDELVSKMKQYILTSFDLRVQQYEEDIKEKEQQRNLPGWNFNTFFVLKEGLARGFESVGLVEDAISGYDELAVRLESIVADQSSKEETEPQTVHFELCTDDLQRVLFQSFRETMRLDADRELQRSKVADLGSWLLDTDRKPFRSLILENNISIFDFECYIFARRISLLLRKASLQNPLTKSDGDQRVDGRAGKEDVHNPKDHAVLAQICQISLNFISIVSSIIRKDLKVSCTHYMEQTQQEGRDLPSKQARQIMDNIVNSWIFSACEVILNVTTTAFISGEVDVSVRRLRRSTLLATLSDQEIMSPISPDVGEKSFPRRTSSLSFRGPAFNIASDSDPLSNAAQSSEVNGALSVAMKAAVSELAGKRGELLALAKRTLDSTGEGLKGWSTGLRQAHLSSGVRVGSTNIELQQANSETVRDGSDSLAEKQWNLMAGILNDTVKAALISEDQFIAVYEHIAALASAHYSVAGCPKMVDESNADLAIIYYELRDFEVAVNYFKQLSAIYNDKEWLLLSVTMLNLWAQCLQELHDTREAISIGLRALALANASPHASMIPSWSLTDLLRLSRTLDEPLRVTFEQYFAAARLGRVIEHDTSRDSFTIRLSFRSLVPDTIEADKLWLQIRNVDGHSPPALWLEHSGTITIRPGPNEFDFSSMVMSPGWYSLDRISLLASQIEFQHQVSREKDILTLTDSSATSRALSNESNTQDHILIWACAQNLSVEVESPLNVDLSSTRTLSLRISSGRNNIKRGMVNVRPSSAGLRLYQAEAELSCQAGEQHISPEQHDGIAFGTMTPNATMMISLPYSLETERTEVIINTEVKYETDSGYFTHISNHTVALSLAVAVTVQDTFNACCVLSKFTIGAASPAPVQFLGAEIVGNKQFAATLYGLNEAERHAFQRHPTSLLAKIERLGPTSGSLSSEEVDRRLHLDVKYQPLDELILQALQNDMVTQLPDDLANKYSALLCGHLRTCMRAYKDPQQLELCSMLGEVRPRKYEEHGWERILNALVKKDAFILRKALKMWHQSDHVIPRSGRGARALVRQLRVPVDLPETKVLHTIELILRTKRHDVSGISLVEQGQVVAAELTVQHTRQWSHSPMPPAALTFCYDLHTELDNWLIGGQRSATFKAEEDEVLSFSIFLLPQKLGHLPLPKVNVTAIGDDGMDSDATTAGQISCEVDYVNQADTVFVMSKVPEAMVKLACEDGTGSSSDPQFD